MIFVYILASVISLVALIFLLYALIFVRPRAGKPQSTSLLCGYAHRGLHDGNTGDTPENSLSAFEKACQAGYGIELDVQLSRDGVVMVFHDYTLIRMTGKDGKVAEYDAAELQKLSLANTEQKIPSFAEVLSLVNGRVPLLIELKGESFDSSLCPKVAEILKSYEGDYCIESFNPLLIKNMRKLMPDVFYGQLYTNVVRDKKKKSALNIILTLMGFNFLARPDFIAYNIEDRSSFPVWLTTKLYNAEKFIWTARSREEYDRAHALSEHPIFENLD
ncbi:MAG: glycerophosphodiester phosphodiesterase [Clostridia bacterium]|nr:glycerophosphodiester phosphodiesterase [Clostridia bacterium]MBR2431590.1 glycerophosphodiester phosphodiesterase [Clostridia bacterium]